jgi:hypothetical protein
MLGRGVPTPQSDRHGVDELWFERSGSADAVDRLPRLDRVVVYRVVDQQQQINSENCPCGVSAPAPRCASEAAVKRLLYVSTFALNFAPHWAASLSTRCYRIDW